jgi:TPR repeat protein
MKANTAIRLEDEPGTEDILELAKGMFTDFQSSTSLHALNDIVFLVQHSLVFLSSAPTRLFVALTTLADALYARSNHSYDIIDLNKAISSLQNAIKCCTEGDQQQSNMNSRICGLLAARFDLMGDISDLQTALNELENGHIKGTETSTGVLESVAFADEQFRTSGNMADLNTAVTLYREGIAELPQGNENCAAVLNNLAAALLTRFGQGGQRSDLNEAISLYRQALELQLPPHLNQSKLLNNLANALVTRFHQEGQQSDLDETISLHRQALELQLSSHPNQSSSFNNLASALRTRFLQGGQQRDLDEAISLHRKALELQLPPHPNRFASLTNLASALTTRFQQVGQQSDFDEAISLYRQALELQLPPHPNRSTSLNNLASVLLTRFHQRGQQSDLDETISLHRQALELQLSPHPNQFASLNNLASALWTRFEQAGQQSDLDEAISLYRQALELFLPPHPNQSALLNNLASALSTRFEQGGQQNDLNEAISLHRQALKLQLPPHPNRCHSLSNLANALSTRFEQEGQQSDLDEAMALFLTATQYYLQSPSQCLHIAKDWIHCADRNQHISAIDAYETALQALPQVAALSLDVKSRQGALTASDGLARDASRCAIRSGHIDKAIELLEAGRSIFWSQVLSLRSPFDQLHKISPELADKLQVIATALEIGSHRDVSAEILDNQKKLSIDQESSRLNRLNEEWAASIHEVRKLQGFEDFLCPSRISSLKSAASEHPVVILIANDDSSHCLIMTSINVHHIPLPTLGTPVLHKLRHLVQVPQLPSSWSFTEETQEAILWLMEECTSRKGAKVNHKLGSSDDIFRYILRILWDELVSPVINLLELKVSH